MTLRLATEADSQQLEELLVCVNGETYRLLARQYIALSVSDHIAKPSFLVHEHENTLIGACAYSEELFTIDVFGISWVSVHPDYRQKNIATNLIKECINHIKKKAQRPVTLIVNTYPGKTGLYDKTGFTINGMDVHGGHFMTQHIDE